MLPSSCTYFAYFIGLLWVINLPHGEIPSELQIQRHPRICYRKCLQHSSMETECLLSCQLVWMLELLVLCITWLFVGNYCCLREEVFQMPMLANAELTVRNCVEEKVWTVQNVNETWWASLILFFFFLSHLKQIFGFKRFVELFSQGLFDLIRGRAWLYTYIGHQVGVHRSQKKESNALELELEPVVIHYVGAGGLNPGPLQQQLMLLAAESSLQPWFVRSCLSSPMAS